MPTKVELTKELENLGATVDQSSTKAQLEDLLETIKVNLESVEVDNEGNEVVEEDSPEFSEELPEENYVVPEEKDESEDEPEDDKSEENESDNSEDEQDDGNDPDVEGVVIKSGPTYSRTDWRPAERGDVLAQGGTAGDIYPQKSVLYTDGNSGQAHFNLERAYEVPEVLQSNDPDQRASGDESLSEAARNVKTNRENKLANFVKKRTDRPASREALNRPGK